MFINYFKNATTNNFEQFSVKAGTKIKDVSELKNVDFINSVIYVNGFQKDENYVLKENDLCTMRSFPSGFFDTIISKLEDFGQAIIDDPARAGLAVLTGFGSEVVRASADLINDTVTTPVAQAVGTVVASATGGISKDEVQSMIDASLANVKTIVDNSVTNIDKSTNITNNITNTTQVINPKKNVQSPDVRGCSNGSALNKPYPFVIGKTYCSPVYCGAPYTTISDADKGHRVTYHALYLLAVNDINVTDIALGLKTIATNNAKTRSGEITIDGEYPQDKYDIHLEVQNESEVSLYPQKVHQEDINLQLQHPEGIETVQPFDRFSAPFPQKVECEFYLDGLVGRTSDGKESAGTVKIKLEYSKDGGTTWLPFGKIGNAEGISYDSSTGETTITMQDYHSMRLQASLSFSYNEIKNAVNHVIELRASRTNQHVDDNYLYDTVTWKSIRTYCYDPELSKAQNTMVIQRPMISKDVPRTTRLGFSITTDDELFDLQQFNCQVQALGRTCTEVNGNYVWSDTKTESCNPASMALEVLESNSLGTYKYNDAEIDMQSFGELYKFCDEYDINDARGNHVGICANGIVSKQTKLADLIQQIVSVGRAVRIYNGNKIGVFIDKPINTTTLILNNQNVLQASNTKKFDELPSGIKAGFVNEDNFAQEDFMYIDSSDAPSRASIEYTSVERTFNFQTNVEQIKKNGLYELAKMKLRPEGWNRKVTSEGCLAFIGAKIEIQDDTIAVGIGDGAEIIGFEYDDEENPSYITKIKTDGRFDVTDATETYGLKIQQTSNMYGLVFAKKQVVINEEGVYSDFVLETPISLNEAIVPNIGDILSFGVFSRITMESICLGKTDNGDGTYDLSLVPYVEEIYTADSGELPEFDSKVSRPSYYRITQETRLATKEDVQKSTQNIIEGNVNLTPATPTNLSATAYQNYISIDWLASGNELKDSIKEYTVYLTKDYTAETVQWTSIGRCSTNSFTYNFNRSTEGYVNATDLSKWKVKIKAKNIYGNESSFTSAVSVNLYVSSSDYVWKPKAVTVTSPVAKKEGFYIEWANNGFNLGESRYIVKVYDDETLLFTSPKIKDTFYTYEFNRASNKDGYPEKSSFTGVRDLRDYIVVVEHINEATEAHAVTSTESQATLNLDSYGTWRIAFASANVSKDVVDRTVTLKLSASGGNLVLYGDTKFKVSIKRTGIDYPSGSAEQDYPTFTPDTDWYKPDLYADPLVSETNYKTNDVDGYEVCSGRYSQTLPLIGQDSNNIVNTIYAYKISAYNESGFESSSVQISATALCTSLRDIVKAHADYKELYVEKLSAITANLGMISQGGMGDFDNLENCWALTDLSPTDTGLSDTIMKGTMRVGDDNEFFRVTPYIDPIDPTVRRYKIELKAGNISLTSNIGGDSLMDFTGGTYIYDNTDSTKRLALTSRGIIAQQNIGTAQQENWQNTAFVQTDERGNMLISNTTNTPEFGFKVTGDIYHFDDRSHPNYAESGSNTQSIAVTGTCINSDTQNPIINSESSKFCFEGDITKDITSFSGIVVLFSKSTVLLICNSIGINTDGTYIASIAQKYNDYIRSAKGTGTVGSYLGLSQTQISNGIFSEV